VVESVTSIACWSKLCCDRVSGSGDIVFANGQYFWRFAQTAQRFRSPQIPRRLLQRARRVSGLALSSVIFPYGASRKPPNISDHFKLPGACCSALGACPASPSTQFSAFVSRTTPAAFIAHTVKSNETWLLLFLNFLMLRVPACCLSFRTRRNSEKTHWRAS
jgi:hypothetical protein